MDGDGRANAFVDHPGYGTYYYRVTIDHSNGASETSDVENVTVAALDTTDLVSTLQDTIANGGDVGEAIIDGEGSELVIRGGVGTAGGHRLHVRAERSGRREHNERR